MPQFLIMKKNEKFKYIEFFEEYFLSQFFLYLNNELFFSCNITIIIYIYIYIYIYVLF